MSRKSETTRDVVMFAVGIIALWCLTLWTGCTTKSRHLDIKGAYLNQSGSVAIGQIEVQSAPEGVESAMVKYEDSAAWFSDQKEHSISILMTGTNSVQSVVSVVKDICTAFIATAPIIVESSSASTNALPVLVK